MALLTSTPRHDRSKFLWINSSRSYSTEASLLGRPGDQWFGPLYDDACDEGFYMRRLDGQEVMLYLRETHRRAGDVTHWTFMATVEAVRKFPALADVSVTVFNT